MLLELQVQRVGSGRFFRLRVAAILLLIGLFLDSPLHARIAAASENARVKHVSVMGNGQAIEVEIQTSDAIIPESQTISGPDRIIIDFPGALPAAELRALKVDRGALKAIRTGLFSENPPITRVVLDLTQPQPYQVFANGNRVMMKLMTAEATGSHTAISASATENERPAAAKPVSVNYQHGVLRIHAKGASLADVLFEVQKQTGAEIPIPAGAEREMIAVDLGPAPAQDVLAALLNGSRYNFIFVDGDRSGSLQKAILSVR